jgi:hypothetical protein
MRQLRKLHTGLSQIGNEILHPAQRALDCLDAIVRVDVIHRGERLLEPPQIEVAAKRRHRVLQSSVLTREILEVTNDVAPPAATVNLARLGGHGDRSGRQQTVDPREGLIQVPSIVPATAATQSGLASTKPQPQTLTIDQHAPIAHDLGKEGRLGLGVFELNDVNRTTDEPRELRAEVDNALKPCVAQIDEHIDIAPRRIHSRSDRAEQQRKADILLRPQSCT